MKRTLLLLAVAAWSPWTYAVTCPHGQAVRVVGDVPGAISYDIYRQMKPLTPQKLARFVQAQQVWMIPDGTVVCTVSDDGVADPTAVLINGPQRRMNYWLSQSHLIAVEPGLDSR